MLTSNTQDLAESFATLYELNECLPYMEGCELSAFHTLVWFPAPTLSQGKGLVTTERFLGCADSEVLMLIACLHDIGPIHIGGCRVLKQPRHGVS